MTDIMNHCELIHAVPAEAPLKLYTVEEAAQETGLPPELMVDLMNRAEIIVMDEYGGIICVSDYGEANSFAFEIRQEVMLTHDGILEVLLYAIHHLKLALKSLVVISA